MTDEWSERLRTIERINVIGTSGSGKSTFGAQLAAALDLPFTELDGVFWGPNWRQPPDDEFIPQVEEVASGDRWVIDGNYTRTIPVKWRRVQLVVWLDLSFPRTIARVTRRCWRRARSDEEIWAGTGNRETLRQSFLSRKSVILWSLRCYGRNRRRYAELCANPPAELADVWFVRLRSPREVARFLGMAKSLPPEQSGANS